MFVVLEAVPPFRVIVSNPNVLLPCVAIRETSPVGTFGEVGVTETFTFIGEPCVTFTAFPPFSVSPVIDDVNFTFPQLVTRLFAFTVPKPVASSYAVAALNPLRIPNWCPAVAVLQSMVPVEHGGAIVPMVTSLNTHVPAGPVAEVELQLEALCVAASLYKMKFGSPCGAPIF